MKESVLVSPLAPAVAVSNDDCVARMITGSNIRVLEAGYAAIIYSSLKAEEWEWIFQNFPALLQITGESGDSFRVESDSCTPDCVKNDHVVFSGMITRDGFPTIPVLIDPESEEDNAEHILRKLGEPLNRLAEVEQMALMMLPEQASAGRPVRNMIVSL